MPLTALVDGELCSLNIEAENASVIGDGDWVDIRRSKKVTIRCAGCGAPMHTREWLGLRIFAHNPGFGHALCASAGESVEHDALKTSIATAAKRAGATVELEVPVGDKRVDVLAKKAGRSYVFEAQLASLKVADAVDRDKAYRTVGATAWFHTGRRLWRNAIPALMIDDTRANVIDSIVISRDEDKAPPRPIPEVVRSYLAGHIDFVFHEDRLGSWGYFRDVRRTYGIDTERIARKVARRQLQQRPGAAVSDVCTRSDVDLSERPAGNTLEPCARCGTPTVLRNYAKAPQCVDCFRVVR